MRTGAFSFIDLAVRDDLIKIPYHGWTSGPDEFELERGYWRPFHGYIP